MSRIGRKFVPSSTIQRRMNAQDDRRAAELRRRHPLDEPFVVGDGDGGADPVAPVPDGAAPAGSRVPVVVEVALEPVSINMDTGVVEVALVPVLATGQLPVSNRLTDRSRASMPVKHKRFPKPSRVARAIRQTDARTLDRRKLVQWAFEVKTRDQWKDRRTGARLLRTLNLDPNRAEAHHVVSRDVRAVRYDIRNGICLSYENHWAVERGELRIIGTAWFTVGGVTYINASEPVRFRRG